MRKILVVTSISDQMIEDRQALVPAYACGLISRLCSAAEVEVLLVDDEDSASDFPGTVSVSSRQIKVHKVVGRSIEPGIEDILFDDRRYIFNSQRVCKFLQDNFYDFAIIDIRNGYGFVPVRSKRVGLDFRDTVIVSWLSTCHEFERDLSLEAPDFLDNYVLDRQRDFAERYSCENSDLLLIQAEAIRDWYEQREWRIDHQKVIRVQDLNRDDPTEILIDATKNSVEIGPEQGAQKPWPLVSVCVAHFNDGENLVGLLKSLEKNAYDKLEVVVVDDGSSDAKSLDILKQLESRYCAKGWRFFFKKENDSIGPTRNFAVSQAKGEIVIFMDSDNLATPDMVFDFVRGLETSGMDCLTCAMIIFVGDSDEVKNADILCCRMPVGPCLEAGIYFNEFGDANFCVRKEVFLKLGGFTGVRGEVADDWEFLARLFLSGFKLDVVPKPIFYYRVREGSWLTSAWSHNSVQALRKKILLSTRPAHQEAIHNMLLHMIAENERLREVVKDSDRKIVRLAIRLSNLITPQNRVALQRLVGRLSTAYRNSFVPRLVQRLAGLISKTENSIKSHYPEAGPLSPLTRPESSQNPASLSQNSLSGLSVERPVEPQSEALTLNFDIPANRPVFGFVGDLSTENNPLGFLRLAYWMQMFGDNSYFVMVGSGAMDSNVLETCLKYRLSNFKRIPDMNVRNKLYPVLSGFVVTGGSNKIPLEMIEALSFGVPVFCNDNPEARKLLRYYGSGFTVGHDPEKKDFADCFRLWKQNIEIYRSFAVETAGLVKKSRKNTRP